MRRLLLVAALFCAVSAIPGFVFSAPPAAACTVLATSDRGSLGTSSRITIVGACPSGHGEDGTTSPASTKTILCGRPSSAANGLWNKACGAPRACSSPDPLGGAPIPLDAFATVTLINGRWTNPVVWCPAAPTPAVTLAGIRQQAQRLLPRVGIGIAPPGGVTLVNIQTVLWADTPADRTLPAVTVVGRRVALRIHLNQARWDFGDGSTDTSPDPGKPYDGARDPCRTKQCPGYYGHTYTKTGSVTITLTLAWHAQYDTGGGWTDIPGDLTGPTATQQLTVKQARAVLVPNPGDH